VKYIFIVNGRSDKDYILPDLMRQIEENKLPYEMFVTSGPGEGTRYVSLYCDFHHRDEVCFVACGGSGTANEVISGVVGRENKYVAIMAYGGTNDFTKCYPDLDFLNLKKILDGSVKKIDVLKVNDSYSFNVVNIGFDSMVANYWSIYQEEGVKNPMGRALALAILRNRFNTIKVVADGKVMCRKWLTQVTLGNGRYCGGRYMCCPRAVDDDGLMEVVVLKPMSLLRLLLTITKFEKGKHLDDKFCRRVVGYERAKHVELSSKRLFYLSLDGEMICSSDVKVDLLEKSINLIFPA